MNERLGEKVAENTSADETQDDQRANNDIIPSCLFEGLFLNPWLLKLATQTVTLESATGNKLGYI